LQDQRVGIKFLKQIGQDNLNEVCLLAWFGFAWDLVAVVDELNRSRREVLAALHDFVEKV
jgi:hypothetical protein